MSPQHFCQLTLLLGLIAILAITPTAFAQTDLQRAQNLVTCLGGSYPTLCKRDWLSTDDRARANAAERRENLETCLTGRYLNLCNKAKLSPEEQRQVVTAERRENLRTCMTGRYRNLCDKQILTEGDRAQVLIAERAENLRTCLAGRYMRLCDHSLLTKAQLTQVQAAEARVQASRPSGSGAGRRVVRGRGYSSGCDDGHWVDSVSDNGSILILEDGSVWEVDSVDAIDSSLWLPTTDIIACDDKLINIDENETVSARRLR